MLNIFVYVIIISKFLQRPKEQGCGNKLIHRHLVKTLLIFGMRSASGQDPMGSGWGGWCLELKTAREVLERVRLLDILSGSLNDLSVH